MEPSFIAHGHLGMSAWGLVSSPGDVDSGDMDAALEMLTALESTEIEWGEASAGPGSRSWSCFLRESRPHTQCLSSVDICFHSSWASAWRGITRPASFWSWGLKKPCDFCVAASRAGRRNGVV